MSSIRKKSVEKKQPEKLHRKERLEKILQLCTFESDNYSNTNYSDQNEKISKLSVENENSKEKPDQEVTSIRMFAQICKENKENITRKRKLKIKSYSESKISLSRDNDFKEISIPIDDTYSCNKRGDGYDNIEIILEEEANVNCYCDNSNIFNINIKLINLVDKHNPYNLNNNISQINNHTKMFQKSNKNINERKSNLNEDKKKDIKIEEYSKKKRKREDISDLTSNSANKKKITESSNNLNNLNNSNNSNTIKKSSIVLNESEYLNADNSKKAITKSNSGSLSHSKSSISSKPIPQFFKPLVMPEKRIDKEVKLLLFNTYLF